MANFEVRNIQRGTLNGRQVKFFEVWYLKNGTWRIDAKDEAPARVANKSLLEWHNEKQRVNYEPMLDKF